MRNYTEARDEDLDPDQDPDPAGQKSPDPDPVLFSTDPEPTCNNGFLKLVLS